MKPIKSKFQIIHSELKKGIIYIIPSMKEEDSLYTIESLINFLGLTNSLWDELPPVMRLVSYKKSYFNKPIYFATHGLGSYVFASRELNSVHQVFPSIPRGKIHVFKYHTLDKKLYDLINKNYNPFFNLDIEINIK